MDKFYYLDSFVEFSVTVQEWLTVTVQEWLTVPSFHKLETDPMALLYSSFSLKKFKAQCKLCKNLSFFYKFEMFAIKAAEKTKKIIRKFEIFTS